MAEERNAASRMRRIKVTHTSSHVYDQAAVDLAWFNGPKLPDYVLAGDEDSNPESRAIAVYTAYGDSLLELFHPLQDDDVGYEVSAYDPEA